MKRSTITSAIAALIGTLTLTAPTAKAEQTALVLFETKGAQALRQEGMAFLEIDPEAPDCGNILARIDLPPDMIGHHIFYNPARDRAYARGVSVDQPADPTDLVALLTELVAELGETGPAIAVMPMDPVNLALRRTPIRRALRNLLENAQRYGKSVQVSLHQTPRTVDIWIDDSGPGIPEADLDRVFDPFTRLETSRSRDTGGIGLGLPIARAILRAHGGDVRLTNRSEGGLRAISCLPGQD